MAMKDMFRTYMGALAEAMHQELPNVSDARDNPDKSPLLTKYYLNA